MGRRMFVASVLAGVSSASAVPLTVSHQGRLLGAAGGAIEGTEDLTFRLFDVPASGTSWWSETHPGVTLQDGYYAVNLGTIETLEPADFDREALYLEVQVGSSAPMGTRTRLGHVPLAARAAALVPGSDLEVASLRATGTVTLGDSATDACNGDNEGEIRWTGSAFQGCTGARWVVLAYGVIGQDEGTAATSCQQILAIAPASASAAYWIDPDGSGPIQAFRTWCQMGGGEGWTLIETAASSFNLNATYWSSAAINPSALATFGTTPNVTARLEASQINGVCRGGIGEVRHRYANNALYVTDQFEATILQNLDVAYALRGDSNYHMGFRAFGNGSHSVTSSGPWRRYNGPKADNRYCASIHTYCGGAGTAYNGWGPLCDTYGCDAPGQGRTIEGHFWWAGSNSGNGLPHPSSYGTYGNYGSRWCR